MSMTTRRNLIKNAAIALPGLIALNSCGTLIYPERRGRGGSHLDPQVVIMDGLLCLLFILPGVIAFVVDFSTGAIYTDSYSGIQKHDVPGGTEDDYDAVLATATGRQLKINDPALRVAETHGKLTKDVLVHSKHTNGRPVTLLKDTTGKLKGCKVV